MSFSSHAPRCCTPLLGGRFYYSFLYYGTQGCFALRFEVGDKRTRDFAIRLQVGDKRRRDKPAKLTSPAEPGGGAAEAAVADEDSKPQRRKPGPKPKPRGNAAAAPPLAGLEHDGQPLKVRKKPGRKPKEGEPEGAHRFLFDTLVSPIHSEMV